MLTTEREIDYDAIIRRAHELRAEAIIDMARAVAGYFRFTRPMTTAKQA